MFRRGAVTVGIAMLAVLVGCSTAKPTRSAFADHALDVVANVSTDADRARTKTVFECVYDHIDDATMEDFMDVAKGEKLPTDLGRRLNTPLADCYKTLTPSAATSTTTG